MHICANFYNKNSFIKSTNLSFSRKESCKINKAKQVAGVLPKAGWVTQNHLDEILSRNDVAERLFKKREDKDWHERWKKSDTPTTGNCYAAAEFWYFFVDPESKPMRIDYEEQIKNPVTGKTRSETHYFLLKENGQKPPDPQKAEYRWRDKIVIDPSRSQYTALGEEPDYSQGKGMGFLTEFPSRKACIIAEELGIIPPDFYKKMTTIFRGQNYKSLSFEQKKQNLQRLVKAEANKFS